MSDIVERLRNCSSHSGISYCVACKYEKDECCEERLMAEAADEITRLRDDLYYDYLKLEEELEAERKKHEWVSVKDRLPEQDFREKDNKVAVLLEDGSVDFAHRMAGTTVFVSPSRVYLREVTHWWSLPDPPKGEEE